MINRLRLPADVIHDIRLMYLNKSYRVCNTLNFAVWISLGILIFSIFMTRKQKLPETGDIQFLQIIVFLMSLPSKHLYHL
jgi:hypothetical protein